MKNQIASGVLKGRKIDVPSGIRPTQERVRKALFDILRQAIKGCVFLELFAGSGAVGIEALSNGVCEVVFVESNRKCVRMIRGNVLRFLPEDSNQKVDVVDSDALEGIDVLGGRNSRFDCVFIDPPYATDLAKKTLQKLSSSDILMPHCTVIAEHNKKDKLDVSFGGLTRFKQKRYGDTLLSFYTRG